MADNFINRLPKKNTYETFFYNDWIELGRMLSFANGAITYAGACGALISYVGTRSLILYDLEDPQVTGPFYFLSDVVIMGLNNPVILDSKNDNALRDRPRFNMEEVYFRAIQFFRL